jgi:hypothetical protein
MTVVPLRVVVRPGEQVLVLDAPGRARVRIDSPRGQLEDRLFDVRTLYSGLSAGTELR